MISKIAALPSEPGSNTPDADFDVKKPKFKLKRKHKIAMGIVGAGALGYKMLSGGEKKSDSELMENYS